MKAELNVQIFRWIHAGAGTRPIVDNIAVFFAENGPYLLAAFFVVMWFFVRNGCEIASSDVNCAA